jgi:hypothetical protein
MKSTIVPRGIHAPAPFGKNERASHRLKFAFPCNRFVRRSSAVGLWALTLLAGSIWQIAAQPTLVSSVPSNGATGVSPSAAVVFTFSTAMNTNAAVTYPVFYDQSLASRNTIQTWNSASNILTCTPSPPFPSPQSMTWSLAGRDPTGNPLNGIGYTTGSFSTGGSAGAARPILTNAAWAAGVFSFDILTSTGQVVTVVSSTNVHTSLASWPVLVTTNSTASKVHISDPRTSTNKALFYRARNGP